MVDGLLNRGSATSALAASFMIMTSSPARAGFRGTVTALAGATA
jgi:hypothetical protein